LRSTIVHYPTALEILYKKELNLFVKQMFKLVESNLLGNKEFKEAYLDLRFDEEQDNASTVEFTLSKLKVLFGFLSTEVSNKLSNLAKQVSNFNKRNIENSFEKPVVLRHLKNDEQTIKLWISENVFLIKSIETNLHLNVTNTIYDGIKRGLTTNSLAKNLANAYSISIQKANLIARDQIAKLNGQLTMNRKLSLGLNLYIWATAGNEKVRNSHKVLESKICDFNNSTIYKDDLNDHWKKRSLIKAELLPPGFAINCQCTSYSVYYA
jgi:uncharacterized protein with gpF-like domain